MISKEVVTKFKRWFANYIYNLIVQYPGLKENISVKANHCKKVSEEIVGLARNLKLNNNDVLLAETIGLFHDVGRFKQYIKYQTFADNKSQDHAELAIEVLNENKILKDLSNEEIEIIHKSILNHNKADIFFDNNEKINFFSKLIRDADKLDIWRLITEYYMVKEKNASNENKTLELELPDSIEISNEVFNAIINKQVVLKESLRTLNDFKLLQIGWLFDLNFEYSVKRLYEKKYLDKIFKTLPKNEKVDQIKKVVNDYFESHLSTKVSNLIK
ncbi:MAG TPA: HD domain-containing protein [Bacteroidales bacterium]|nr:HD domain-containing protein [Bacteroidales bacterium]